MLRIVVGDEGFNHQTNTFELVNLIELDLEHSLISLSKWESKYQKPFLSPDEKSAEEVFDYLKAMVLTANVDLNLLYKLSKENVEEIQRYIDSPQSATTFGLMRQHKGPGEVITAELIYYWMVAFSIPFECQYWHLNRLFSLIRICGIKNSKEEPMSRHDIALRNRELNRQRREKYKTAG